MKNLLMKFGSTLAALALVFTTMSANSACSFIIYQDKLPEDAKSLRKF